MCALCGNLSVLCSDKNYNNEIGVPQTLFQLSRLHRVAVIEMGMRSRGEIARLAEIARPTIGVITNIGLSHIERLGSRDGIAAAKAELLEALPPDGLAVIPTDDDYASFLLDTARPRCRAVTFGYSPGSDYHITNVEQIASCSSRFLINQQEVVLQAVGEHNVLNAAAACAVSNELGIGFLDAAKGMSSYKNPPMRVEVIELPNGCTVINDSYNAAPDSMKSALRTLIQVANGRRTIAILGDMRELGVETKNAHRDIGRFVVSLGVNVVVTVGNDSKHIGLATKDTPIKWIEFANSDVLSGQLRQIVEPGDVVLVKGSRSMKMEKIVEEFIRLTTN